MAYEYRELTTQELLESPYRSFQECEFGDDDCGFCAREHVEVFYVRTCWDVEEGDYYCRRCASIAHLDDEDLMLNMDPYYLPFTHGGT
jgi:hypothetical protein